MARPLPVSLAHLTATRLGVNTAFRFAYPFLPAIARGLGVPLQRAGFLLSIRSAAGMATPLVVAAVGTVARRIRLSVVALSLFSAGAVLVASAAAYGPALVGFALIGLAKPVFDVAAQSYVAERTDYRRRARVLSILELTWSGALLIGAPAAAWLVARHGWQAPFWALAGVGAAAALAVPLALDRPAAREPGHRPSAGLSSSAVMLLAVTFLFSSAADTSLVAFGAWLEDRFGFTIAALGGAAALIGFSELVAEGMALGFTDRIGKRRSVAIGLVVATGGFVALALTSDALGAGLAALAVTILGTEFTVVAAFPLASEMMPEARGRYLALIQVMMAAGRTAGAAVGPFLFTSHGFGANAAASAGAACIALLLLLTLVRHE
ncbi:MAG TPA: MFS transporter [Gemmatimonadales bacterium]|nr:MFS transporter [Gemmatimonadales bacterium]